MDQQEQQKRYNKVLRKALTNTGWSEMIKEDSGVYKKGICFLFFDDATKPASEFHYEHADAMSLSAGGSISLKSTNVVQMTNVPNTSWHLECEGFVIGFGKLGKNVGNLLDSVNETQQKALDEFLEYVNTLADNITLLFNNNKAEYLTTAETVIVKSLQVCEDDDLIDNTLLCNNGKFFMLKSMEQGIAIIPVIISNTEYGIEVSVNATAKPLMANLDMVHSIMSRDTYQHYQIDEMPKEVYKNSWELNKNIELNENLMLKDFEEFNLSKADTYLLNYALNNCLNVTVLLRPDIDTITKQVALKFLAKDLSVDFINGCYQKDAMETLLGIAESGYSLRKYANPSYNTTRIHTMFESDMTGFSEIAKSLEDEGYNQQQIKYIQEVASYGKGIKHVKTKEAVTKLYLRQAMKNNYLPVVCDYMIHYAFPVSDTILKVSWDLVPQNIKDVLFDYFSNLPEFECLGHPWSAAVESIFKHTNNLFFIKKYGFLLEFRHYYLGIADNSVFIKNSAFATHWNAMLINNKVIVNETSQTCQVLVKDVYDE